MPDARALDCIISDIDGCLGPERHGPLDARRLAQVAEYNRVAQERGDRPRITLCSGRPQPYAEAMSRVIANTTVPVICEMGVWLYDPRDNRFLLDPAITDQDMEIIAACTRWVRRDLLPLGVVIQPGKSASISLWHPDTAFLMGLKPAIQERTTREGWGLRVANTVAWINLELGHISKGSGIERLCTMMGYAKARLAGIGDTMGDMAIRDRVAWFACPANAEPQIKETADYVSPHDDVHGVLDILERIAPHAFIRNTNGI